MVARGNEMESWAPSFQPDPEAMPRLSLAGLANQSDLKLVRLAQAGQPVVSDATGAEKIEAKAQSSVQVPRLDGFNSRAPVDRFRFVADEVTASSRIRREHDPNATLDNYRTLLKKMHPSPLYSSPLASPAQTDRALADAAKHTAIVDLRTRGDRTLDSFAVGQNDKEMDSEQQASQKLGITYLNRPMISKVPEAPDDLKATADLIHKQVQAGKEVDIHCYHGTDRTGLVVDAYKAAYDPRLSDLVKNHGQKGVDDVYRELGKELLTGGVDPATHAAVFQSLRQYLQFLHDGKNGNRIVPVQDIAIGNDAGQQQSLRNADAALSKPGAATLDNYRDILIKDFDRYDPATHNAFYRQLDKDFSRNYVRQHTP